MREGLIGIGIPQSILFPSFNGIWFNSTAAVTVFFVISGFCIHRPYVDGRPLQVAPYLTRRLLRVGIPLAVVFFFLLAVGGSVQAAGGGVLWTVYCELIYYVLYPMFLIVARRIGMAWLLAGSIVVSLCVIATDVSTTHPGSFGELAWVVCLPYWLIGCMVAEKFRADRQEAMSIWLWRAAIFAVAVLSLWLVFHSPIRIGYPISMLVVSFVAAGWIMRELARYRSREPLKVLEGLGKFSYSIYLIHSIALAAAALAVGWFDSLLLAWLLKVVVVLVLSFAFYLAVERPSHRLARALSKRIAAAQSTV